MEPRVRTILFNECADGSLYQLADPDAPNEMEFQSWVARALTCVYPGYSCLLFEGSFVHGDRSYRPDLALVAKDFSHWFVIEVELVSHSFEKHVLPQVRAFCYGTAGQDCVSVLARELGISPVQAKTLIEFVPRAVVVIANKREPHWQIALKAHDIQLLAVSVFRSKKGLDAVELDGTLEVTSESLGFGVYSVADRSMRFHKSLRLPAGGVQINDPSGGLAFWTVTPDGDRTWVTKDVGFPDIEDGSYVQLVRTIDGHVSMRRP
jgi:hypothetical protein